MTKETGTIRYIPMPSPKWIDIFHMVKRGNIAPDLLQGACEIADELAAISKAGHKSCMIRFNEDGTMDFITDEFEPVE